MNRRKFRRRAKMQGPSVFYDVGFLIRWLDRGYRGRVIQWRRK